MEYNFCLVSPSEWFVGRVYIWSDMSGKSGKNKLLAKHYENEMQPHLWDRWRFLHFSFIALNSVLFL